MQSLQPSEGRPNARTVQAYPDLPPFGSWWRAAIVGAVALLLALGGLEVLQCLARPLALLLAALVIAAALAPIVGWLDRWLPRTLAIALIYLLLLLVLGGIGWLVVPVLLDQLVILAAQLPALIERARVLLDRYDRFNSYGLVSALQSRTGGLLGRVVALPLALASSVLEAVLVVTMSAYWLIALPAARRFALSLVPAARREGVGETVGAMGHALGGYLRAVVIHAAIVGTIVYGGLSLIGVEYPLVLAVIAGLGELVPILGPFLAAVPALGIALLDSPRQALIVLVFYLIMQQIESNLLTPYIMRRQVAIPPLLTLFALLAGGALGGILYALLAIPLTGALRVLLLRAIAPAVREWTGAGEPAVTGEPQERGA